MLPVTKPENCVLAFGIPTSQNDFRNDRAEHARARQARFASLFRGGWAQYEDEILEPLQAAESVIIPLGVRVVRHLTLDRFGELFKDKTVHAVILFSHWTTGGDAVEFRDGFKAPSDVVAQVPIDFTGMIDLSACHPKALASALKRDRPACLVRETSYTVTPFLWLMFYITLYEHLKRKDVNYLTAMEGMLEVWINKSRTHRQATASLS